MSVVLAVVNWFWLNVTGNLVASMIWGVPALYIHFRRTKAHHGRILDEVREHLHGGCACDPLVQVSGQDSTPLAITPAPDSALSG